MGKKVFGFFLFLFLFLPSSVRAVCSPPYDYTDCPKQNPDINFNLNELTPSSGDKALIPPEVYTHTTDPGAPQLGTLLDGEARPEITSLYQVSGDTQPGDVPVDFATAVGFATDYDQAVLVPVSSRWDPGSLGGNGSVMVLYADANSLTLKYTAEDSVETGYTLHVKNLQVDPTLLDAYNRLNSAGRSELPLVAAGMQIGSTTDQDLIVAIRDTGTLLDPRWQNDWWLTVDPAFAIALILGQLKVLTTPTFESITCNPSTSGDQDSRPVECDACNRTDLWTPSCATSFTINDQVKYNRGGGLITAPHCVDVQGNNTTWGGTITIDPSNVTLPFAGKKGQENEQKYLADYFEGTSEYYQQKNYPKYWLDWIDHAGVFRKLTPMEYQDQLKKQMVSRAVATQNIQKEGVHNYNVTYEGRLCWDLPLLGEAFFIFLERNDLIDEFLGVLNFFPTWRAAGNAAEDVVAFLIDKSHYCVYQEEIGGRPGLEAFKEAIETFNMVSPLDIKIREFVGSQASPLRAFNDDPLRRLPPDLSDPEYANNWQSWKDTKWGKLWTAVPMFSREDTPGEIIPYVGTRSKDTVLTGTFVEKVPHLARLYEVSQEINKLLFPSGEKRFLIGQKENEGKPIIASSQVLGESSLLAQGSEWQFCGPTGDNCFNASIRSICCSAGLGSLVIDANGYGHLWVTINGAFVGINKLGQGMTYHFSCPASPGENFSVSVAATNHDVSGYSVTGGCSTPLDESGSACCAGGEPPEIPLTCGLTDPSPVSACSYPAVNDNNPNDTLCCDPINIGLSAVDAFENPEYDTCKAEGLKCEWILMPECPFPPDNPLCKIQRCHDPCQDIVTKDVSRQVGVNLRHPYLSAIWDQTGDTEGLFNIFRPSEISQFEEVAARSQIKYRYTDTSDPKTGEANPGGGDFYFPYLGGIQTAKNWLVKSLFPSSGTSSSPSSPVTLDYTVDYRNSSFVIDEEVKADIIQRVKNRWPNSKIEENWDLVYQEAISHGFNPAFVIAIWIEESGASGVTAWDLGCGSGPKNNLTDQLDCFFNRLPWITDQTTFAEFMCYYSDGHYPCNFSAHPNFPGGVKYWFDLLNRSSL